MPAPTEPAPPPDFDDDRSNGARASIDAVVGDAVRGVLLKVVIAFAVPALLAMAGAAFATYTAVQVQGTHLEQSDRERSQLAARVERVESGLREATELRAEIRALKATNETALRGVENRLGRVERVLDGR